MKRLTLIIELELNDAHGSMLRGLTHNEIGDIYRRAVKFALKENVTRGGVAIERIEVVYLPELLP